MTPEERQRAEELELAEDKIRRILERKHAEELELAEGIWRQLHPFSMEAQRRVIAGAMARLGFNRIQVTSAPFLGVERWRR